MVLQVHHYYSVLRSVLSSRPLDLPLIVAGISPFPSFPSSIPKLPILSPLPNRFPLEPDHDEDPKDQYQEQHEPTPVPPLFLGHLVHPFERPT